MFDILDEREFYNATLEASGVVPKAEEISKFAEKAGVPVEVVKLAKAFFEQLQLDGVPFETEAARADDAMTMAKNYFAHIEGAKTAATKIADGLVRFLAHAAEGYLAQQKIEMTPLEALKIAGLQADSQIQLEDATLAAAQEQKIAELSKLGMAPNADATYADPSRPTFQNLMPDQSLTSMTPHMPETASAGDRKRVLMGHAGLTDEAHLPAFIHNWSEARRTMPADTPTASLLQAATAPFKSQPGFIAKNKLPLAAAGIGAGALYLMHRKNQDAQDQKNRQLSRAAALPPA